MAPRAATSSEELMGSVTEQGPLRLLRELGEQSGTVQLPARAGMHLPRSWKCHVPSRNATREHNRARAGPAW